MYTPSMNPQESKPLALLYVRVSKAEQVENSSLASQEAICRAAAERKGYRVEVLREEGKSAKSLKGRTVLASALRRLQSGEASALYAYHLSRVARSVVDYANLLAKSAKEGWTVVVLDADVDTSTPAGKLHLNVLASVAQYESEILSERIKDGLAQRRREGVRLGRPSLLPSTIVARIASLRAQGSSLRAIAEVLTREEVPTAQGGAKWHASTIKAVLAGQDALGLVA